MATSRTKNTNRSLKFLRFQETEQSAKKRIIKILIPETNQEKDLIDSMEITNIQFQFSIC